MKESNKKLKVDLLENGMINEVFPKYINTNGLSKIKFGSIKNNGNKGSSPATINLLKNDGNNRIISIPNPVSYFQLVNDIFEKEKILEELVEKIQNNKFSHSKILTDDNEFNIPIKGFKSNYEKSRREKMFISIGMKYRLKYDIEKFYDSIYTHYIPAGLLGYEKALEYYENDDKNERYKYMVKIDKDMRNLCNAETKGIITGPFTSRIFSELLQSEIDNEITGAINNDKFRRYVDDTEIYISSLEESEKEIEIIKRIFQKYKLFLKIEKTEIKKIPYIDFDSLCEIINIRRKKNNEKKGWYFASQDDLFVTLEKAEKLCTSKSKGPIKYILKVLGSKNYEYGIDNGFKIKDKSFLYILNYLLKYPQYSKEIINIIDKQIIYVDEAETIINNTLKLFIEELQHIPCLYLIDTMANNKLKINENIIFDFLNNHSCDNEILKATMIKILCINNKDNKYKKILTFEKEKMKNKGKINFQKSNWMSKYVLYYHNIIEDDEIEDNDFYQRFKLFKTNNIKFVDLKDVTIS